MTQKVRWVSLIVQFLLPYKYWKSYEVFLPCCLVSLNVFKSSLSLSIFVFRSSNLHSSSSTEDLRNCISYNKIVISKCESLTFCKHIIDSNNIVQNILISTLLFGIFCLENLHTIWHKNLKKNSLELWLTKSIYSYGSSNWVTSVQLLKKATIQYSRLAVKLLSVDQL